MIRKILKFLSSPVGDTMVINKEEAKELVISYQGLEMGAMACEVLVYAIKNDVAPNIKEYCDTLISDAQFMLHEYNKIFKERQNENELPQPDNTLTLQSWISPNDVNVYLALVVIW